MPDVQGPPPAPLSGEEVQLKLLEYYAGQENAARTGFLSYAVVLFAAAEVSTHAFPDGSSAARLGALVALVFSAITAGGFYELMRSLYWVILAKAVFRAGVPDWWTQGGQGEQQGLRLKRFEDHIKAHRESGFRAKVGTLSETHPAVPYLAAFGASLVFYALLISRHVL